MTRPLCLANSKKVFYLVTMSYIAVQMNKLCDG
jgi:hypothetical protein